jgi:hypothetical protein
MMSAHHTQPAPGHPPRDHASTYYVRSALRRPVNKKPAGSFTVESGDEIARVLEVVDVSRTGLRLQVDRMLAAPATVIIHYRTLDLSMQLNGVICWQSPVENGADSACLIGIDLMGPSLLFDQL